MNTVLETIARRRSCRQFKPEQLTEQELQLILEAGLQAPSGHNDQSWYFAVIQNKDLLNEISREAKLEMQKAPIEWMAKMGQNEKLHIFYDAPTVILAGARKDAVSPAADICAAMQNMIIASESLDIGTCWIGLARFYFKAAERYQKVGFPPEYEFHYALALGHRPERKTQPHAPARKYEQYFHVIR